MKLSHWNWPGCRVNFPDSDAEWSFLGDAQSCLLSIPSTPPSRRDAHWDPQPCAKLFAGARRGSPKPPRSASLPSHCLQTGRASPEQKPGPGRLVLGGGRACDTGPWQLGASQGDLDAPLCLGRSQAGEGPRKRLPGAGTLDEDTVWIIQHVP